MPAFTAPRHSRLAATRARLAEGSAPWLELARQRVFFALDSFAAWLVALAAAGPAPRIWIAAEKAQFPATCPGCGGAAEIPLPSRRTGGRELNISLCDACALRQRDTFKPHYFLRPLLRIGAACLIWLFLSLPWSWRLRHFIGEGMVDLLMLFPLLFAVREILRFYRFRMAQLPVRVIPRDVGPSLEVAAQNGAWLAQLARMNEASSVENI